MSTFNKMMNDEKITVQFHVVDLKVSQKNQSVLEDLFGDLGSELDKKTN